MKFSIAIALTALAAVSVEAFSFSNFAKTILHHKRGVDTQKCNQGNLGTWCNDGANCKAKCWVENGGKYDCYDYVNGKCPWGGMWDRGTGNNNSKFPAATCDKANHPEWRCDTNKEKCPPCWILNGGKYDCYDYKNGKCEWQGMIDTTK